MGADVSRQVPAEDETTSSSRSKCARTKRAAETGDEGRSSTNDKKRVSRRKSNGRNERKSILDISVDNANLTAFYEDISKDLDRPHRVQKLYKEVLDYALRQYANSDNINAAVPELVKTALMEWHEKVTESGGWDAACESSRIRPNPKNKEMELMLKQYKSKLEDLEREKKLWEDEFTLERAADANIDGAETTDGTPPERQIASGKTNTEAVDAADFSLQLDVLEQFVRSSSKLVDAFEENQGTTTSRIQRARFSNLNAGEDPKKLLRAMSNA